MAWAGLCHQLRHQPTADGELPSARPENPAINCWREARQNTLLSATSSPKWGETTSLLAENRNTIELKTHHYFREF